MAGAMRLGQHCHEIETHIENMVHAGSATPHAFEELLAHYDHALLLFEQLQRPDALLADAPPAPMESDASAFYLPTGRRSPGQHQIATGARARRHPRPPGEPGRRSVDLALAIGKRSRNPAHLAGDFSDNLARLRRQLREVEMQAESQIASRMAISSEREFDPLEFDRFTRLQELTRMMAESVNDVASFHESLTRSVDTAHGDLDAAGPPDARPAARPDARAHGAVRQHSERLFRVARQSAKEVDKRVNLDIRGGNVEIDRSVLERMSHRSNTCCATPSPTASSRAKRLPPARAKPANCWCRWRRRAMKS
jgi:chemosensory pili system protein ChpA (sensor histidine kinase/response regulator)